MYVNISDSTVWKDFAILCREGVENEFRKMEILQKKLQTFPWKQWYVPYLLGAYFTFELLGNYCILSLIISVS